MSTLALLSSIILAASGVFASPGLSDEAKKLSSQCNRGAFVSCIHLGILHRHGVGAPLDTQKALELFVAGCEQGYALACAFTGDMAYLGSGVVQNAEHGEILMRRSCTRKNEWACETLRRHRLIDPEAKALY